MDEISRHRRSIRLKSHDYSYPGAYFVTVCAHSWEMLFGKIVDGKIILNDRGNIVNYCWREIPAHFPNTELDEFVIMPNHAHGIITINSVGAGFPRPNVWFPRPNVWFPRPNVKNTKCDMIGRGDRDGRGNPAPTLGQIVAYFKYETAKQVNKLRNTPGAHFWQRNYYEHVIRNDAELNRIRQYIIENPLKWDMDCENPDNIIKGDYKKEENVGANDYSPLQ